MQVKGFNVGSIISLEDMNIAVSYFQNKSYFKNELKNIKENKNIRAKADYLKSKK